MKQIYFMLFLFIYSLTSGQIIQDSTKTEQSTRINYKKFILPAGLMVGGFALLHTELNDNVQTGVRKMFGEDYENKSDDFLQYSPIALLYGGRLLGLKPRNSAVQQTVNLLVTTLIVTGATQGLKRVFNVERPDATDNFSFPSGHTATAFANATLVFYEYKDSNIWYAGSGYLFATATGVMRIANNKHRLSDVMAGAGIGIAAATLTSYWNPFHSKLNRTACVFPVIGDGYGIGLVIIK